MKDGTGGDPFADDTGEGEQESVTEQGTPITEEDSGSSGVPPYAMWRDGVKDGREMVPVWLQESTEDKLEAVKDDVEERLGYDVYLTDFKEAAVLEGLENPGAIARRLDEWGCEYA